MSRPLVSLIACCALIGCTAQGPRAPDTAGSWSEKQGAFPRDRSSRRLLIGSWLSDSTEADGSRRFQFAKRRADGTYEISFRATLNGRTIRDQTEVGLWGVSGDIYFTITQGFLENGRVLPVSPEEVPRDQGRRGHAHARRRDLAHGARSGRRT